MFSWGASTKHELQHVITITDTLRLLTPLISTLSQVPLRPKDSAGGRPDSDCRIWHAANEKRTLWPLSCIFAWEQPLIFLDIPWSTSACSFLKSAVTFPEHTLRETHTDCFSIWEKLRECTFAHGASTLAFSCPALQSWPRHLLRWISRWNAEIVPSSNWEDVIWCYEKFNGPAASGRVLQTTVQIYILQCARSFLLGLAAPQEIATMCLLCMMCSTSLFAKELLQFSS
jgi:hypothetical protein